MKDRLDGIYRALVHPVRRRVIEYLFERNDAAFTELLEYVSITNHGKLGFHIRVLKALGLIEHEPSTRKYRLSDIGKLAAESIWDTRFSIARQGLGLEHEPGRYVRRLRLGDHAVLFYDTEEIKREVSFRFLLAGLLKGEAVIYLVSEHKLDSETLEIRRYGINLDHFREEAFAIASANEWYLRKGKAQSKTIIANLQALVKEKQKAGFAGLHIAGETEVFFDYAKSEELLRYEATLGRQLSPKVCALCLYDAHRLHEEQFIQLNKSHGHLIFKGIAVKTI
ncbi:MAG: MEDS domain-containing protein [Candidatus Bathyarchaeia archaeon]